MQVTVLDEHLPKPFTYFTCSYSTSSTQPYSRESVTIFRFFLVKNTIKHTYKTFGSWVRVLGKCRIDISPTKGPRRHVEGDSAGLLLDQLYNKADNCSILPPSQYVPMHQFSFLEQKTTHRWVQTLRRKKNQRFRSLYWLLFGVSGFFKNYLTKSEFAMQ